MNRDEQEPPRDCEAHHVMTKLSEGIMVMRVGMTIYLGWNLRAVCIALANSQPCSNLP